MPGEEQPNDLTLLAYHRDRDAQGFLELQRDAIDADYATDKARRALEEEMGSQCSVERTTSSTSNRSAF